MEISPRKPRIRSTPAKYNSSSAIPATPDALSTRRSLRLTPTASSNPKLPCTPITPVTARTSANAVCSDTHRPGWKPKRSLMTTDPSSDLPSFSPVTPHLSERNKRQRYNPPPSVSKAKKKVKPHAPKKRVYYKKVVYRGSQFEVGDDVYVKRKEGADSDDDDPEVEACRICYQEGRAIMIECDDCLGGFHLKCLQPPLKKVPEGDWICGFCEAKKSGKLVEPPKVPEGVQLRRTAKEKLLSSDLWAARIESLWKEPDGSYWMKCRWYIIPEETADGRQPHNLKRELYCTNHLSEIEMETVLRHCYVMSPIEYKDASNEGDDVFYCEYEYDVQWHSFKRLSEIDNSNEVNEVMNDGDWRESDYDTNEDSESEEKADALCFTKRTHELAANSRKGRIVGFQRVGIKKIPEHVRCHKQTDLEKAKAALMLATLPKALPCRTKEMDEINTFVKGAICDDNCLGRCLYIHGVPGTGKTISVLAVMRKLNSEVDAGTIRPYCFIEINGLKLSTPESIYKLIYEALSGHRVGWKKALHFLNERFSNGKLVGKEVNRPCILLIDELDLLLTRNQSVLYNILDWPTKPHSKLVVIGIANTMDLPEKLLPRISSRMGIQKLCFGPYNYKQLHEIISSRLMGLNAFEEQAIEFASRKVAAMSGDARRALEICRRAADLADFHIKQSMHKQSSSSVDDFSNGSHLVRLTEVEAAIHEVFQAPHIQLMKNSPRLGKIFLVAMVHELYRSGLGEITFEQLATTVSSLCCSNREALPGWDTLLKVGCKLAESRIVICEEGRKHKLQKLQLNFPSDDVAFALKDCSELPWLCKYL